jgi:hypothetical protein
MAELDERYARLEELTSRLGDIRREIRAIRDELGENLKVGRPKLASVHIKCVGSRQEVWDGLAKSTSGQLKKEDLELHEGVLLSKKELARKLAKIQKKAEQVPEATDIETIDEAFL